MSEPVDVPAPVEEPVASVEPVPSIVPIWKIHSEYLGDEVDSMKDYLNRLFKKDITKKTTFYYSSIFQASVTTGLKSVCDSIEEGVNKPFMVCLTGLYLQNTREKRTYVVLRYRDKDQSLVLFQISHKSLVHVKDEDFMTTNDVVVVPRTDYLQYVPVFESCERTRVVLGSYPPPPAAGKRLEIKQRVMPKRPGCTGKKRDRDAELSEESYSDEEDESLVVGNKPRNKPSKRLGAQQKRSEREYQTQQARQAGAGGQASTGGQTSTGGQACTGGQASTAGPVDATNTSASTDTAAVVPGKQTPLAKLKCKNCSRMCDPIDEDTQYFLGNLSTVMLASSIPIESVPYMIKLLQGRVNKKSTELDRLNESHGSQASHFWEKYMEDAPKNRAGLLVRESVKTRKDVVEKEHKSSKLGINVPVITYLEHYLDWMRELESKSTNGAPVEETMVVTAQQPVRKPLRVGNLVSLERVYACKQGAKRPTQYTHLQMVPPEKYSQACFVGIIRFSECLDWLKVFNKDNRLGVGPHDELRFAVIGNPCVMATIPKKYQDNIGLEPLERKYENLTFWKLPEVDEIRTLDDADVHSLHTEGLVDMCLLWDRLARENLCFNDWSIHEMVTSAMRDDAHKKAKAHNKMAEAHNAELDRIEAMTPEQLSEYHAELLERQKTAKRKIKPDHWAGKRMAIVTPPTKFHVILIPIGCLPLCFDSFEFQHSAPCSCNGPLIKNPIVGNICYEFYRSSVHGLMEFTVPGTLLGFTKMHPSCLRFKPRDPVMF